MLLYLATLALIISVFAFLTIKVTERPAAGETKYIGDHQIAILRTAIKGDKVLLYVDQASKIVGRNAVHEFAESGGVFNNAADAGCGDYYSYMLWSQVDNGVFKKCIPGDMQKNFGNFFNEGLSELYKSNEYLSKFNIDYTYDIKEKSIDAKTSSNITIPILVGEKKVVKEQYTEIKPETAVDFFEFAKSFIGSPYLFGGKGPPEADPWKTCFGCIKDACHEACLKSSSECSKCIYRDSASSAWKNQCKEQCGKMEGNCPEQCKGVGEKKKICPESSSSPNICQTSGFDCSGYVRYLYMQIYGIDIGWDTRDQYGKCENPNGYECQFIPLRSGADLDKLQPGDLIYKDDGSGGSGDKSCNLPRIHHVAMYIGKEGSSYMTYEAMDTKHGVTKGIASPGEFCGAIRIKPAKKAAAEGIAAAPTTTGGAKILVVVGNEYKMYVYESGKEIKSYTVGIGKNGMGKTKTGDEKTPIGKYKIIWKASVYAGQDGGNKIEENKAFCGPGGKFTADPQVGYSSESLWKEGYGGNEAVVMGIDYPNEDDKKKGYSGNCIEMHATHLGGLGEKSSAGCVRMNPQEARELYKMVDVGTTVIFVNKKSEAGIS